MTFVYKERVAYERQRRSLDVLFAVIALLITLPLLLLACAAILLEDGRPVFFRQRRVGRFGRLFWMYKLRTMAKHACGDAPKPYGVDARVTTVGRFLRRTSIDELPQFYNVIRGDMSVVGPRPEMPLHVRSYQSWQHMRHLVRPGVTGMWQTVCRSTIPLERPEATSLDLDYVREASTGLDAVLIARTITTIFTARGAY